MAEPLITEDQLARLLANGARSAAGKDIDPKRVVKLFTPDAGATWLLTEHKQYGDQAARLSDFAALPILIQLRARRPLPLMPGGLLGGSAPWRGARGR